MRTVLRPSVDRRYLLTVGARLSLAAFASATIWPHSGACQTGLVEGYADGDEVKLYFVQGGEGELMLFLHGAPDSWTIYTSQLAEFSRDHMVVAPNLRGFPPSDQPEAVEAYAMPRLLGDVHALLRHFGRERCILVGNDWGGYIAWVFASAYPDRVERLVILNAPHPAILLREIRNSPAQIQASQYERDYYTCYCPLSDMVQLLPRGSDQGAFFHLRCSSDRNAGPRCPVLCRCSRASRHHITSSRCSNFGSVGNARPCLLARSTG